MEADWEVEIGPDAPVIDAFWEGFVDLRHAPERAGQLPEVGNLPGLADALVRLNAINSPVWTSKCDVWPVPDPDQLDPDEMDASSDCTTHAWACYIDLLPRSEQQWITLEMTVSWCRVITGRLHVIPLPCCRVDIIIRSAVIASVSMNIGLTAYLTACGSSPDEAKRSLQDVLGKFVEVFLNSSTVK